MNANVVVIGAGPTGLLLAGDLAAAGVRTTLIERRTAESELSRAFAVHARTLEVLDMRDLADRAISTGNKVPGLLVWENVMARMTELPSRYPFMLVTPQYQIERLLRERAVDRGAELLEGQEMTGLRQDADGVELTIRSKNGEHRRRRASYVVGADGMHSTVRHAIGLPFPGNVVASSVMLADVRLTEPPDEVLSVNGVREGFVFIAPFGDGWYRVIGRDHRAGELPDDAPVDLAELRALTVKVHGTDFGMHDARWLSRFHSEERQAPHYRVGRVFLAGDAAHVHSPAGGQGMNTGLQDAANLSWKLAAAVQGWAPDWLLDSYEAERHPIGKNVLRTSGILMRLALLRSPILRAARNAVSGTALRLPPVRRRVALGMLSGVGIGYPAPAGAHRLAGTRATDRALAGGGPGRLFEALRSGRFILCGEHAASAGRHDRVDHVAPASSNGGAMLIRPDGYIAWAADRPSPEEISTALTTWCTPS